MTTELTNEQIAKVFAMYLFTKADNYVWHTKLKKQVWPILNIIRDSDKVDKVFNGNSNPEISFFRLLLTPLSAISDEDAIEAVKIFHHSLCKMSTAKAKEYISYVREGGTYDKNIFVYQYLIQKGYAVPLFIAPNHPANGKTAIELGLAIDITKEVDPSSM